MNLFEFKQEKTETFRNHLKEQIREGLDLDKHFLFTSDEIKEIKEEILIEDSYEIVEDFEELILGEEFEGVELMEYYDFIPEENGQAMNIEVEIDLDLYEMDFAKISKMKDLFFAEEFEVEVLEESTKAKIVFKRSKGKVTKKKKCGKGMRLVGNRCLPQTGSQKSKERRKGIKLKRAFKAMGAGKKKKAKLKGKITSKRVKGRSRNLANTVN